MSKKVKKSKIHNTFSRLTVLTAAVLVLAGVLIPLIHGSKVSAVTYSLITSRSIEMSDSNVSDANVTYQVGFTPASTATIKGIVVDFCATSPIIGETCTPPTGFSVTTTPTVATTGGSNTGLGSGWTASYLTNTSQDSILTLVNSTGVALTSSTPVIFTLSTATNPSTLGTFYARILTYTTTAGATGYSSTSPGTITDAGGIALSTVSQLTIQSKVQEQITFCIDTNSASLCSGASGTSVLLGDSQDVLSTAGPYVDKTAQYIIQTNATGGAAIRIKGTTLTDGGNTIAATGTGATSSTGTSQFGMCTYELSGSNLTIESGYNGGAAGKCLNTTQSAGTGTPGGDNGATFSFNTTNTTSTFGDWISDEAAGAQSTGTLVFLGNTSATQTAGVYSTVLTFIATGTF